ncbi:unnamed protein product [Ectocarpus sp. 12 AP-2014]
MTSDRKVLATEELKYQACEQFLPLRDGDVVYCNKNYDGDTCTLAWVDHRGNNVRSSCRIKGIDTPELRTSSEKEKTLALRAKDRLEGAVVGQFVTVRDPGKDKYNRILAGLETETIECVKEYMLEDPEICKPYQGGKKRSWG